MEDNLEQLINRLSLDRSSPDLVHHITVHLQQQNLNFLPSFISQNYQSLINLEHWAWQLLSQNSHQWFDEQNYFELFQTLALFNKNLIFNYDNNEVDCKVTLLIPNRTDWIHNILKQFKRINNLNDLYIIIVSHWFDNLSYILHENPHLDILPTVTYISHYISSRFLISDQFKNCLSQFQGFQLILTPKQLFFIKTCSFFLSSYLGAKAQEFLYTADQIIEHIGENYLQIIHTYTQNIELWNEYILIGCTHLIHLVSVCCWWGGEYKSDLKVLFSTEQISSVHVQALVRIISYKPFYHKITSQRSNDETILIESTLLFLINIVQNLNLNWFFRSIDKLSDILLTIAETLVYDRICLYAYGMLGEILTDEQLKDLKVVDSIGRYFFNMLEQSWHHRSKKYKQIPILYLLRGFLTVSKNDTIQQKTAQANKVLLFIEMCDQYPIVYDILWALSFNHDIQVQMRRNSAFMTKLKHLLKQYNNEQIQKTIQGILWNLEANHQNRISLITEISNEKTFDIMISYSHRDEVICRRIYDELIRAKYRVWIDFDQMHGNVMDAMAQAIEQSKTILICMSEEYRRSNYCRAEAHYAFQRQLRLVPILIQNHYKPDSWLLFLIGQLLYVDFIKYEFSRAMDMLIKELEAAIVCKLDKTDVEFRRENDIVLRIRSPTIVSLTNLPDNILDWTQTHVHDWLVGHHLRQLSSLFVNCDGRSLVYLHEYIKNGEIREVLPLLKDDSLRYTKENLSLVELSCFRSLMDQQTSLVNITISSGMTNTNRKKKKRKHSPVCCRTM